MHYEANNQDLYKDGKAKDVVVIDAGAEWNCYGADIVSLFLVTSVLD